MKKTRQFMMLVVMIAIASPLFAQLPSGSYGSDISMKKLNSTGSAFTDTVCTIYEHTNAGRAVIMDVSAIWCAPCWSYHGTHALKTLFEANGPNGTNEVMVYYVEGDGGTIAQLNGASNSQGNWVSGSPYPILPTIAPNNSQVNSLYSIGYFPTVYLICPDRKVTEIGTKTAAQLIAGARACPALAMNALDASIFKVSAPASIIYCGTMNPVVTVQNYGTTAITSFTVKLFIDGTEKASYDWTGNIERLEIVEVSMPTYVDATLTSGSHTVKLVIDNPNSGTDLNLVNNEKTMTVNNVSTFGGYPVAETFSAATFPPSGWSKDDGNDGKGWIRSTAHNGCAKMDFYNISKNAIDYLMLPPVDMTSASAMNLGFKVSYAQYQSTSTDKIEVQVSSNCGATWSTKYSKSGASLATASVTTSSFTPSTETQWRQESVDLTSYAGQSQILIRFKATSGYGNNAYIDEINLSPSADVASNDMVSGMLLSPNPSNSNTDLEFYTQKSSDVSVVVVNSIGAVVYSSIVNAAQGFNTLQIPSENFNSGIYFVSIKGENSNSTQKLIIQK